MGEDLYRLISAGLLGAIVLLLLLGIWQIGRLQRSLAGQVPKTPEPAEPPTERAEADPIADEPIAAEAPTAEAEVVDTADVSEPTVPDEEGPFERDGRWWFRRDGDLLVYDEQLEEWVDPNATPLAEPEPVAVAEPEPVATAATPEVIEPHPLDEARGWDGLDTRDPATEAAPAVGSTPLEEASPAPIPEPVSAPAPITETSEGAQGEAGTHWKCPACGVINGSTATSCRMCFAARP